MMSMVTAEHQKGRIHIQFGKQIDIILHHIADESGTNERLKLLAEDRQRDLQKYRLFPNNYIAYDLYFKPRSTPHNIPMPRKCRSLN